MSETYGQYTVALPCACGGADASHLAGRCTHLGVERAATGAPIPLFPAPICRCRAYSPTSGDRGREFCGEGGSDADGS
ncbi:MAG: hypothetical protein ACREJS_06995 [Candidatus Rokuibacteriota bacterium]